ncbi:hypothetical protein VTO42DRAFT_4649 [Malbranchea cinnamomea]
MDRDRDRRYDEPRRGGESYRPGDRSYRRSPRPRSPPPFRPVADTWAPSRSRPRSRSRESYRRRSRSPPYRERERDRTPPGYKSWSRARSPPRRLSSGRDRSPPRISRRSRSPPPRLPPSYGRSRSPIGLKRDRDESPPESYYPRSPKRERRISPIRSRYEPARSPPRYESYRAPDLRSRGYIRSRSPDRRGGYRETYGGRSWRRRTPTPPPIGRSAHSAQGSTSTSRRSSPPIHPDKAPRAGALGRSPGYPSSRSHYEGPPPPRSPPPSSSRYTPRGAGGTAISSNRSFSPRRRSSVTALSSHAAESPPPKTGVVNEKSGDLKFEASNRHQAPSPAQQSRSPVDTGRSNDNSPPKQPPTQPRDFGKSISPPTGPSAASKLTFPVGRNTGSAALLSAPTRPKGASGPPPFHRENSRDFSRSGPPRRGPYTPSPHHGPPPPGPRGGPGPGTPYYDSHRPPPPFHRGNSTSTTYPHTKRFNNHLSGLPSIVPGGKLMPSGLDPVTEKRLAQLEADKEKLLEQIAEKQRLKRAGLREWDKLSRETATNALRSDLAEGHLQRMTEGDGIGGATAF